MIPGGHDSSMQEGFGQLSTEYSEGGQPEPTMDIMPRVTNTKHAKNHSARKERREQ